MLVENIVADGGACSCIVLNWSMIGLCICVTLITEATMYSLHQMDQHRSVNNMLIDDRPSVAMMHMCTFL